MKDLLELVFGLYEMAYDNEITSKVVNKRNYLIKTNEFGIIYAGQYGIAKKKGLLTDKVSDIVEHKIRYYEFTYKSDFLEAVQTINKIVQLNEMLK